MLFLSLPDLNDDEDDRIPSKFEEMGKLRSNGRK